MIAAPQHGPFQVAELVEQKEWVIAGSLEVSIVHCSLLLAVGFADGAIEVEDPLFGRFFFSLRGLVNGSFCVETWM